MRTKKIPLEHPEIVGIVNDIYRLSNMLRDYRSLGAAYGFSGKGAESSKCLRAEIDIIGQLRDALDGYEGLPKELRTKFEDELNIDPLALEKILGIDKNEILQENIRGRKPKVYHGRNSEPVLEEAISQKEEVYSER